MASASKAATKIVGIGRNYAAHISEMGSEIPKSPLLFLKPPSSIISSGSNVLIPYRCRELHYEVELAVVMGGSGPMSCLDSSLVMSAIQGYCVALDMTARDLQSEAKKAGTPWALAKGFDTSCVLGEFVPADQVRDLAGLRLRLNVNGNEKQNGHTDLMLWKVPTLVEYISRYFTLMPGDIILTGTPEGVGPVVSGDLLEGYLEDSKSGTLLSSLSTVIAENPRLSAL